MPRNTHTVHIDAPPEAIWSVLAERFGELDAWAKVPNCRLESGGPVDVGTTRLIDLPIGTLRETIVCFDGPTHLAYEVTGLPLLEDVRSDWILEADDTGTTVRFDNVSVAGAWPVGPMIARLMQGAVNKQLAGLVRSLKRGVEAGL